ncbi:MAG: glycosyltransferase, partial [Phycisphaerae bacterium]
WLGARSASGDYLLFTDGDVKLRPEMLRRAMNVMLENRLDHLTLYPDAGRGSFWETVLMSYFVLMFSAFTRAALARFRWARRAAVGIGAFNLVKRSAYEAVGTHRRLRLEVADDVMLGRVIKQAGFRQDAMLGKPLVFVRWQTGVGGIIRGLEKNAFAGTRYSLPMALLGIAFTLAVGVALPILAVTGPGRVPLAIMAGSLTLTMLGVALEAGYNPLVALFWPMGAALFAFTIARSTYLTLRNGGITWRGTFYPLAMLKAGMTVA